MRGGIITSWGIITFVWWCLALSSTLLLVRGEEDDFKEVVLSSIDEMPFDEEGKLETYLLLYPESCAPHVRAAIPHEHEQYHFFAVAGPLQHAYFGHLSLHDENEEHYDCSMVSVQKGLDQRHVTSPMARFFFEPFSSSLVPTLDDDDDDDDDDDRLRSSELAQLLHDIETWFVEVCLTVEISFMSYHANTLEIMWVGEEGNQRPDKQLLHYGEPNTVSLTVELGSEFVLVDVETNEDIFYYEVEFDAFIALGEAESEDVPEDLMELIERDHEMEWSRHGKVKRTFSPLGFQLGRVPDDVMGSIEAFYYNNRYHGTIEEFDQDSYEVYINRWEVNTYVIVPPWALKAHWQDGLRRLVEDWIGVEVENTDIYGLRRYEQGARLLSHVDREETHAVSLIINVAQHDSTDPWPVEVYDHAKRLHEVVMNPGDIVYYESAKCLHGRNRPLPSGEYVNLFAHYRPKGDPQWYEKENPEGAPEPLMDVGECRLVGELNQFSQGAVECNNSAIGPHLSPTMFETHSAKDLFGWWKGVGPPFDESFDEIEEEEMEGKDEFESDFSAEEEGKKYDAHDGDL